MTYKELIEKLLEMPDSVLSMQVMRMDKNDGFVYDVNDLFRYGDEYKDVDPNIDNEQPILL